LEFLHGVGDVELALKTHLEFNKGNSDFAKEGVHALAFLETDDDVGHAVLCLALDFHHVVGRRQSGQEVSDHSVDSRIVTSSA